MMDHSPVNVKLVSHFNHSYSPVKGNSHNRKQTLLRRLRQNPHLQDHPISNRKRNFPICTPLDLIKTSPLIENQKIKQKQGSSLEKHCPSQLKHQSILNNSCEETSSSIVSISIRTPKIKLSPLKFEKLNQLNMILRDGLEDGVASPQQRDHSNCLLRQEIRPSQRPPSPRLSSMGRKMEKLVQLKAIQDCQTSEILSRNRKQMSKSIEQSFNDKNQYLCDQQRHIDPEMQKIGKRLKEIKIEYKSRLAGRNMRLFEDKYANEWSHVNRSMSYMRKPHFRQRFKLNP